MDSCKVIFDISSDEEPLMEDTKCGDDNDDYLWLSGVLEAVNKGKEDPDEIVILSEHNSKPSSKTLKVTEIEDDDDDDCVILDGDPDDTKVSCTEEVAAQCDGDSDEVILVSHKGQVACRDYPHARHLCAKYPFNSTPHESHCVLCHCFVCDSVAPCLYWSKEGDSHCHATYKVDFWKAERARFKQNKVNNVLPVPKPSISHVPTLLPQPASIHRPLDIIRLAQHPKQHDKHPKQHDNVSGAPTIRVCSSTRYSVPNIITQDRSQQNANFSQRGGFRPVVAHRKLVPIGSHSSNGNSGSRFVPTSRFKRSGHAVAPNPYFHNYGPNSPGSLYTKSAFKSSTTVRHPNQTYGVQSHPQVSQPIPQINGGWDRHGYLSQNPANLENSSADFAWVNKTVSDLPPLIPDAQFDNSSSYAISPTVDGDLHFNRMEELSYDNNEYQSLFSLSQSVSLENQGCNNILPPEVEGFSPERAGFDAGLPYPF